jgi:hypothetical protein
MRARPAHQRRADPGDPIGLTGVVPVAHVAVAAPEHASGVDRTAHRLARSVDVVGIGYRDDRTQQRLAGHAAPVGTFAADQLTFHHRDTEAPGAGALGGVLSDRPGTQHHDVVTIFGCWHCRPFRGFVV